MRFRKKSIVIEAVQWFRNGDHPEDGPRSQEGKVVRYYRDPGCDGNELCEQCGNRMYAHGWIDTLVDGRFRRVMGHVVCPGDWVFKEDGKFYPMKPDMFEVMFEQVEE